MMRRLFFKIIALTVIAAFIFESLAPDVRAAQAVQPVMPLPSVSVPLQWPVLQGMTLYPDEPLKFDFIVAAAGAAADDSKEPSGDEEFPLKYAAGAAADDSKEPSGDEEFPLKYSAGAVGAQEFRQAEYQKLIRYFLAGLAIPEETMWVNLSPSEPDRIIPETFGKTEMGQTFLAQDYILKQLTASLMNPDTDTGKIMWEKIYAQAYKEGVTDIPVESLNKIWIVPGKTSVYENTATNSVFVVDSELDVMMEADYLAANDQRLADSQNQKTNSNPYSLTAIRSDVKSIIREVIIPVIKEEVNHGEAFAPLRQIMNSLILATWYKNALKESVLTQGFADREKLSGIGDQSPEKIDQVYQQYLELFRSGVTEVIKEEYDPATQSVIPRKYFTGGVRLPDKLNIHAADTSARAMLVNSPAVAVQTNFAMLKKENDFDQLKETMIPTGFSLSMKLAFGFFIVFAPLLGFLTFHMLSSQREMRDEIEDIVIFEQIDTSSTKSADRAMMIVEGGIALVFILIFILSSSPGRSRENSDERSREDVARDSVNKMWDDILEKARQREDAALREVEQNMKQYKETMSQITGGIEHARHIENRNSGAYRPNQNPESPHDNAMMEFVTFLHGALAVIFLSSAILILVKARFFSPSKNLQKPSIKKKAPPQKPSFMALSILFERAQERINKKYGGGNKAMMADGKHGKDKEIKNQTHEAIDNSSSIILRKSWLRDGAEEEVKGKYKGPGGGSHQEDNENKAMMAKGKRDEVIQPSEAKPDEFKDIWKDPNKEKKIKKYVPPKVVDLDDLSKDDAMLEIGKDLTPGGIDVRKINVVVEKSGIGVRTAFEDSALLRQLRNSIGLKPVIFSIEKLQTPVFYKLLGLNADGTPVSDPAASDISPETVFLRRD